MLVCLTFFISLPFFSSHSAGGGSSILACDSILHSPPLIVSNTALYIVPSYVIAIIVSSGPNATFALVSFILHYAKLHSLSKYGTMNFKNFNADLGFALEDACSLVLLLLLLASSVLFFKAKIWIVPESDEHATNVPLEWNAMEYIYAYSLPLRSSCKSSPFFVL